MARYTGPACRLCRREGTKLFLKGDASMLASHMTVLAVGFVVAFVVALGAIKWFVDFLTKYGFRAFGWYRIVVGTLLLVLLLCGVDLSMVD